MNKYYGLPESSFEVTHDINIGERGEKSPNNIIADINERVKGAIRLTTTQSSLDDKNAQILNSYSFVADTVNSSSKIHIVLDS
jgi:hypothetical protein